MTDYQKVELKMMQEVERFFNENSTLEKDNKILKKHVDTLRGLIVKIKSEATKQSFDNTGYTKNKKSAKQELANTIVNITASICSFATDTEKNELYEEFNQPISKVNRLSDADIISYATNTFQQATAYKTELKPYQVTAEDLTNLKTQGQKYADLLLIPAEARKQKSIATANIKKLISETLQLLTRSIDNDMMHYKDSQSELYKEYEVLREIDDSQTTALSIKGTVVDAQTGKPLQYVKCTVIFRPGEDLADKVKMTSAKGNYQFDKLPEGKCTITFEKNYYDTLVVDSEVHSDKYTKVDVEMEKESDG